ncbi:hypothetical protein [Cohnella soli]|uniref:Uncharacterized protein n=1 Tax=Cohnella soli TaxID=425005 RepID=A0ABW0HN05_9BACL
MGYGPSYIIQELDFMLTHPSCNAAVIDKFYHNCLMMYDEVPLFTMVEHMRKENPKLLREWSMLNTTVRSLMIDLVPEKVGDGRELQELNVPVDLREITPTQNGIYLVKWTSEIEEPIVNAHFKTKSLLVFDKLEGRLHLVGISKVGHNQYHLYVKKGRKPQ